MSGRPNVSDRGTASPVRSVESRPNDVNSLTEEDIAKLGEQSGHMQAISDLLVASAMQRQNITLDIEVSPSGVRSLRRPHDPKPELTERDRAVMDGRALAMRLHEEAQRGMLERDPAPRAIDTGRADRVYVPRTKHEVAQHQEAMRRRAARSGGGEK